MNITWGLLLKRAVLALIVAMAANVALAWGARTLLGVPAEFEPLALWSPVIATSMYLVAATVVLLLVVRFSKKPARFFWILSTVALLLSFIPNVQLAMDPSKFPGATTAGMVVLALQHVVAFVIFVPWVTRGLSKVR